MNCFLVQSNIYLAKIISRQIDKNISEENFKEYATKESTNNKNTILKSYDLFLNEKYNVNINQVAIDSIKNLFQ